MTAERPTQTIHELWQTEDGREAFPTLEEVQRLSRRMTSQVRRRNLTEYAAGVLGTGWVVAILVRGNLGPADAAGVVLLGLAGLYMGAQLHRRGSAQVLAGELGLQDSLTFYREHLSRQRGLLRWAGRWHAIGLPFWPGILLILVESVRAGRIRWPWAVTYAALAVALAVGIAWLNRRAADRLEQAIDAIDQPPHR